MELLQTIDFTNVCVAIIGVIFTLLTALITTKLIPFLKTKFTEKQLDIIRNVVSIVVQSAEQIYEKADGEKKKEYALEIAQKELDKRGVNIDLDVLSAYIESEVLILHKTLTAEE